MMIVIIITIIHIQNINKNSKNKQTVKWQGMKCRKYKSLFIYAIIDASVTAFEYLKTKVRGPGHLSLLRNQTTFGLLLNILCVNLTHFLLETCWICK